MLAPCAAATVVQRLNMAQFKANLCRVRRECRQRYLRESTCWISQLLVVLTDVDAAAAADDSGRQQQQEERLDETERVEKDRLSAREWDRAELAYAYMQCDEMDRAAHATERCHSPRALFLHLYSCYLAHERRTVEASPEPLTTASAATAAAAAAPGAAAPCASSPVLTHLRQQLERLQAESPAADCDPYLHLLHGMVLERQQLREEACRHMCRALQLQPLLWSVWHQLSKMVSDRQHLGRLLLPGGDITAAAAAATGSGGGGAAAGGEAGAEDEGEEEEELGARCGTRLMRLLFVGQVCLELQLNSEALAIYEQLATGPLSGWTHLHVQRAVAHQNMRQVDEAIALFDRVSCVDPCRVQNMDSYSNLLFVKGMSQELCALAHNLTFINKYAVETCCVVGNYYSLKNQHEKALLYFQRALKVCPRYLSAWTLMGHELLELKNTSAAIQCYRQAIELNQLDYRAWYGLGQTYEILKMPYYCQYYYARAYRLRPSDSRMLMAMGESYENLGRLAESKRCYWKAHCIGDIEGVALLRLARLFERCGQPNRAAAAYMDYIRDAECQDSWDGDERAMAHRYMANYMLKVGQLDAAQTHATRCSQYPETRDEARAILRQVAQTRHQLKTLALSAGDGTAAAAAPAAAAVGTGTAATRTINDSTALLLTTTGGGEHSALSLRSFRRQQYQHMQQQQQQQGQQSSLLDHTPVSLLVESSLLLPFSLTERESDGEMSHLL